MFCCILTADSQILACKNLPIESRYPRGTASSVDLEIWKGKGESSLLLLNDSKSCMQQQRVIRSPFVRRLQSPSAMTKFSPTFPPSSIFRLPLIPSTFPALKEDEDGEK